MATPDKALLKKTSDVLLNTKDNITILRQNFATTWHHGNKPGRLELVDYLDHKTYHKIYHPDGYGGRKAWGGGNSYR